MWKMFSGAGDTRDRVRGSIRANVRVLPRPGESILSQTRDCDSAHMAVQAAAFVFGATPVDAGASSCQLSNLRKRS